MALRDVLSRAAEAVRPRNWTDHAGALEQRLAKLTTERSSVEAELQRAAAASFAEPENRAALAERDALAARLAELNRDLEMVQRALNGARLRLADEQNTEATAARQAKRERATEIHAEIHAAVTDMDAAIDTLAAAAEKVQTLREELATVTDSQVAGTIRTGAFHTLASHRLSALGFDRSMAFDASAKPALVDTLPALDYVLKIAKLA